MSSLHQGPPETETGGRLTIDLSAIAANYKLLASRAAPAECAAVVKADAYGLGVPSVAQALWTAGARTFFVAHVFEARALRAALPEAIIYVLSGLNPGSASILLEINARPVLGSPGEVEEWVAKGGGASAALHIDTGMNRLGLSLSEAEETAQKNAFRPSLVMSHLACADVPNHPLNKEQLTAFEAVRQLFPDTPASLANSAATLSGGAYRFDLCRPGIALYGGNPFHPHPAPDLKPVVKLQTRIVQLREAGRGEKVGYGGEETLGRPSRLAILSLGYADGFIRAAGSRDAQKGAEVIIAGKSCPLVGRISMDLIAADITDLPENAVKRGDYATVLGDGITIDELAQKAGTIGYEILTRLGPRFERIYAG
ncbi:alanine racemase [Terrihabitans soli]|uniref:Alanine racemase n=1 Tax=Terrihabitans soli TaxID=708113 RepID=A0A6S6QTA9_9HYPH|nr:alanine racemase [Terrihabitans soli]BCJ90835.1 alanine racemase [Terrihabitans soli]